ncbi:ATP-binding protein [Paraglaciecola sp.]|uniref:ATP-binding protein n=1 Tax=Paraglaciecola sp. TaxID=1920173 RepID=UPI0030F4873F
MTKENSEKLKWWHTLSILHKIQYSIIGFAFVILLVTALTLSLSANSHFHRSGEREISILAQVLADNSRAALTFNDADAGANILSAVSKNADIVSAVMYKENAVFASYPSDANIAEPQASLFTDPIRFEQGSFFAVAPIVVNGSTVGWLRLQSHFDVWQLVWKKFIATFTALLLTVVVLAFFMSYWLKKHITVPLGELSEWATNVYQNKNFSARARKRSNDEIGQLTDSLNAMLTELSKQESIISLNHLLEKEIAVRAKTERQLIALRDKAEQANRFKSDFLANMSHEIRTPMNAIIGFVDIVLEGDLDEQYKKHLRTVRSSAKDLHNILNDILDIAKLEEGKLELEQAPFSVKDLIEHVVTTFDMKAQSKGIQIIQRVSNKLPPRFLGDALRLKQVLMNLMGNAIKFTATGSITIAVEQLNNEQLQFIVRDTGIGIAKDKLEHIFESFSQADSSTSRKYGGSGLGTTISKRLVELMGGKIWLESDEGVGSTFYFTVNLAPTEQALEYESFSIDPSLLKTEQPLDVLVAEDGEQNAELLRIRLEALGHHFTRAVNGQDAINLCTSKEFDIILMDVQMPVMDGLQASEHIRLLPRGKDIPIIALTASVMHEDRKACFAAGMDGFIKKPIVFNELFTEMAKLLQHRFKVAKIETPLKPKKSLPEIPYINFQQGVNTWANIDIYNQNLKQFAQRHKGDMKLLRNDIENNDFAQANKIIHALKGTAGNLALVELYNELLIMHSYVNRNDILAASEHITILSATFDASLAAIHELTVSPHNDEPAASIGLTELLTNTKLQIAMLANGEFDEIQIRALLQQFTLLNFAEQLINRLHSSIENFDFDQTVQLLTDIVPELERVEQQNATR